MRQLSVGAIPQLCELEVVDDDLYRCAAITQPLHVLGSSVHLWKHGSFILLLS